MIGKLIWLIFVALAIVVGLYPLIYFFVDSDFGLLSTKPVELLSDTFWNVGFYTHIVFAAIALLLGWSQFSSKSRERNLELHRNIGKIYVSASLVSALAGIYIGFFATGGVVSSSGFICLGMIWFYTTFKAYLNVRKKQIEAHQKMMIYSYAACFAGVTLRIWLPILTLLIGNFINAYQVVSWLCWIPNLIVAYFINSGKVIEYRTGLTNVRKTNL